MTWLDGALFLVLIVFLAVGARMGSLWTAAALAGGFLGALLADVYALPLASILGSFPGSPVFAGAALFVAGVAVMIVPGILLSRVFSGLLLGVVDSAFGLITGAIAGLLAVTALLLIVVPLAPKVESSRAWKKSAVVRPLHHFLEDVFQSPRFRKGPLGLGAARVGLRELEPLRQRAESEFKQAAGKVTGR